MTALLKRLLQACRRIAELSLWKRLLQACRRIAEHSLWKRLLQACRRIAEHSLVKRLLQVCRRIAEQPLVKRLLQVCRRIAGQPLLKNLLQSRRRIAGQIYLGLGGAVFLTIGASLVAWVSFNRMGDAQNEVNEGSVPEMAAAFGITQQIGALVAAAPRLTAAATPEDLAEVTAEVVAERSAFEDRLDALVGGEEAQRFSRILAESKALILNIDSIEDSVTERFDLAARSEALRLEMAQLQSDLEGILVPAIDNQFFYAMTGYRNRGERPAPRGLHFREDQINHYRHLTELHADTTIAMQLMTSAFNLSDLPLLEPLRERFEAAVGRIERRLAALGGAPAAKETSLKFDRMIELCLGDQGGFALRTQELDLAEQQSRLLARNRELALYLVVGVESLVSSARGNADAATQASADAIRTGRALLLVLNGVGIVGAVLVAWLFVGRVLLRRLKLLSSWMRRMAAGDLHAKVEIGGRDEVADMAAALEIFRRQALEAQRLNLVEKLAEELRGKNDELENVLTDLRHAQDQIVSQEKLAALGELTAGVAHEIKNPLNFVKNFSEVSGELLEELQETLQQGEERLTDDQREEVREICTDLTENLNCIREHGDRANRIVHDMLMMGRDSGNRMEVDINTLIKDNALLAFHSARATDSEFMLDIQEDFDPQVGMIEVVPQEIGRVILNMVSNSCHATDEKRRAAANGAAGEPYLPALRLTTKRTGDRVEICVRDNGNGIPPEAIDKIFNPFFTTKPTDRGTGLGLSMSNDIVRKHGGQIRVQSEAGKFTEMTVDLPAKAPAPDAAETAAAAQD